MFGIYLLRLGAGGGGSFNIALTSTLTLFLTLLAAFLAALATFTLSAWVVSAYSGHLLHLLWLQCGV